MKGGPKMLLKRNICAIVAGRRDAIQKVQALHKPLLYNQELRLSTTLRSKAAHTQVTGSRAFRSQVSWAPNNGSPYPCSQPSQSTAAFVADKCTPRVRTGGGQRNVSISDESKGIRPVEFHFLSYTLNFSKEPFTSSCRLMRLILTRAKEKGWKCCARGKKLRMWKTSIRITRFYGTNFTFLLWRLTKKLTIIM